MPFTVLDHTADLHVRVEARTLAGLFAEAARAMIAQMYPEVLRVDGRLKEHAGANTASRGEIGHADGEKSRGLVTVSLRVDALEPLCDWEQPEKSSPSSQATGRLPSVWDDLFHDWLAKILVLCTADRLLPLEYRITFGSSGLEADIVACPIDASQQTGEIEIKAVTYHGLKLERTANGYLAEVIFDV